MLNPRLEMGEDFVYKKTDNNINEFKEYGLFRYRYGLDSEEFYRNLPYIAEYNLGEQ